MSSNSRITILGTVSDINAMQDHRTSAGIIIENDDSIFVIDPGIGTIVRSAQVNVPLNNINAILVSDSDIIYTNDVNAIIEHTNRDIHLISPSKFLKHDESSLTKNHSKNLKIVNVDSDKRTIIKGVEIEAYSHGSKFDSISYKITTGKYVLGYITKAKHTKSLIEKFNDTNILIMNLHNINDKGSNYLDYEEIVDIIKNVAPELVIINGFSKKVLNQDPLDLVRKMKAEIQKDKDGKVIRTQIHVAKELMTINPEIYNIKLKQKRLKGFF
jgi:hypothetical protein